MTTSPTPGQQWEQPTFEYEQPRPHVTVPHMTGPYMTGPFVTGPVMLPAIARVDVPPPGAEEQRLHSVRALVWPIAIVVCILTGSWWPMLILPLAVGAIVRNRLHELRRQRYATAQLLR